MITVERTIEIPRTRREVWERLADFAAISAWADNVDHSSLLRPGGEGPASGVGATRRVQVGRRTLLERVVAWDEPERLAYEIKGLPPVAKRVQNEWRLRLGGGTWLGDTGPVGEGADHTTVTLATRIDCGSRPPQKLVASLLARRLASASETMLAGLADSMKEPSHV